MMNRLFVRVIADFFLIVIPALVLLTLVIVNPTFERGFFCDDESLRYPYHPDTISIVEAGIIAGLVPVILILFSELILHRSELKSPEGRRRLFHNLYAHLGPFITGLVFQQLTAEIGKHIVGRLRPHFIDVCRPEFRVGDLNNVTCDHVDKPWNHYIVVDRESTENFRCTNPDRVSAEGVWDKTLQDAVKSFPSAHSSVSFYGMLYLAVYLHRRLNFRNHAGVVTMFFQMTFLVIAFAIALSRISDYKHHWSDVLSGAILGTITAILITKYSDFVLDTDPVIQNEDNLGRDLEPGINDDRQPVVKSASQTTAKTNETSLAM